MAIVITVLIGVAWMIGTLGVLAIGLADYQSIRKSPTLYSTQDRREAVGRIIYCWAWPLVPVQMIREAIAEHRATLRTP